MAYRKRIPGVRLPLTRKQKLEGWEIIDCISCRGTGKQRGKDCDLCEGYGKIAVHK